MDHHQKAHQEKLAQQAAARAGEERDADAAKAKLDAETKAKHDAEAKAKAQHDKADS